MALNKNDKDWIEKTIDTKLSPVNVLLEKYGTSLYTIDGKTDRITLLETEQHKSIGRKSALAGLMGAGGGVGLWQLIRFIIAGKL